MAFDSQESFVASQGDCSTGPNRSAGQQHRQRHRAGRRDAAHRTPCFVHAVDATLHDTSYALPNYTVFGRFRFVEDDDLEEDDRGFR